MRKLILTTAAVAALMAVVALCLSGCSKKPAQELVSITYDTLTDCRDGQVYRTVKMPDGRIWMAQNLNYQTTENSWCYENKVDNCKKYGRLYDWNTAKTICMVGWHLPSRQEWNNLVVTAGGDKKAGKKLKARNGWNKKRNGTDDFGFSALPGGDLYHKGRDRFYFAGDEGFWWTAEHSSFDAYSRRMGYDRVDEHYSNKDNGFSVRCVADSA